ncbi:ribonuclease R [Spiroplasma sabaudiense Ar-1343]|uniref:Ribonuclease R n=1 Tax=Spiroplasma sabaudiense Ar-1343 TaxID=1276257 RepID=W6A8I6_9MOLU|nr:ribonuclease R [Spiroplasma sabaudiense]AHI53483.1 ribonuclease R [Spiroplasma sabaudiense Ar-1343]
MIKLIIKKLKEKNGRKIYELSNELHIVDIEEFQKIINQLETNNTVVTTENDEIFLLENNIKTGSIKINDKGFGFVRDNNDSENDYFVPANFLKGSITSDEVVYRVETEDDGRSKAVILAIAKRTKKFLVGEIMPSWDGKYLDFHPTENGFKNYRIVMVNKNNFKLEKDQLIKVKIIDIREKKMFTKIVEIIGNSNKAVDRILSIAYEFDVPTEFKKETLKQADDVAKPIDYNNEEVKRRNKIIVDKLLVTIDGEDSKDLDDAIYVEKIENGNYKLYVAIADVSFYVEPRTSLDNEALYRGNSVYLANKVIPMLPKSLSNGVCSLNPNEDKLCLVCEMEFDSSGKIINKTVYESIMNSKARLTYKEVNEFFQNKISTRDEAIQNMLSTARELHNLIEKERDVRGSIDFDIKEAKVILDNDSNVIDIVARSTGISEKLIENFMVSANESVAQIIFEKSLPFVYRDHGKPKDENLIEWYGMLTSFGINPKLNDESKLDPRNIRHTLKEISNQIKDKDECELINITLLRFMEKAEYSIENIGHFGLASPCYTHFTSPIRRYSDLMVHRYLKQYLVNKDLHHLALERNENFIERACNIINETEKKGVNTEREVTKVCMAEYMTKFIGKEYDGIISAVLKFGIFVQLPNCVEGLIHITELGTDFHYDEKMQTMVSKQNKIYRLGQKVRIQVKNADVKKRIIDFTFAKNG